MTSVLRIKPGATVRNPAPAGFRILSALDQLSAKMKRDVVITSGDEGEEWRAATDPHQTSEAYDVSVKGWDSQEVLFAYRFLSITLGPLFTVLYEVPTAVVADLPQSLRDIAYPNKTATGIHFHLQRKKGTTYP